MKFDEWGLRKNKSSKERRVRKTVSGASSCTQATQMSPNVEIWPEMLLSKLNQTPVVLVVSCPLQILTLCNLHMSSNVSPENTEDFSRTQAIGRSRDLAMHSRAVFCLFLRRIANLTICSTCQRKQLLKVTKNLLRRRSSACCVSILAQTVLPRHGGTCLFIPGQPGTTSSLRTNLSTSHFNQPLHLKKLISDCKIVLVAQCRIIRLQELLNNEPRRGYR